MSKKDSLRIRMSVIHYFSVECYYSKLLCVFFADAIPGLAGVFASLATLVTIAIDLVPCTLMVAIVVMCAIAKTTPFVTQPTESALAHRDSSVKSNALFFFA